MNAPLETRFWDKVQKTDGDSCWEWTGAHVINGYGQIWNDRQFRYAHRISWELHYGPIPQDLCVCHRCDNRGCVRPDHLFLGTNLENTLDRETKGRGAKGERQGSAKLTEAQVVNIRRLYAVGESSQRALAQQFGISKTEIARIVCGKKWRHLDAVP